MTRISPLLVALALVGGCSGAHQYTQSDNQKTVDADLGTTFTILLPRSGEAPKPVFSATVLEMGPEARDESGRRTFTFTARAQGETDIRIGKEFLLHVRVTSASDRPEMHVHTR